MSDIELSPEASEAVHKARNAAQALELSREAQLIEIKKGLFEGLRQVFGEGDNPAQMTVLVRRIPILCTNIDAMHKSIEKIETNMTWGVRIVLGAVLLGVLKVVLNI